MPIFPAVAYRIEEHGGYGTGVNPEGKNYPLVGPSADIKGLFADMYFTYSGDAALPLHVEWVYGFGKYLLEDPDDLLDLYGPIQFIDEEDTVLELYDEDDNLLMTQIPGFPASDSTNECDLLVVDANGDTVFDSTVSDSYHTVEFNNRLRIHEWTVGKHVMRIVQHTAYEDIEDIVDYGLYFAPESAIVDARSSERISNRISGFDVIGSSLSGDLKLSNGFNVSIDVEDASSGLEEATRLVINAAPGSGLGRFQNCEEQEITLKTINGIGPDAHGHFKFEGDMCHYVRQPTEIVDGFVVLTPNTLNIGNDCGPCTACDDFIRVYKGIKNVYRTYKDIGTRYMAARDRLRTATELFQDAAACELANVFTLIALAHDGNKIEVLAAICNSSGDCSQDVELKFAIVPHGSCLEYTIPPSSVLVTGPNGQERGSLEPVVDEDDIDEYVVFWDFIQPGRSALVRFRIEAGCTPEELLDVGFAITLSGTVGGIDIAQTKTVTVGLQDDEA